LPISGFCRDALTELGVPERPLRHPAAGILAGDPGDEGANNRYRKHGCVLLPLPTRTTIPLRHDVLLKAYAKAFRASDPVVLVLKDYGVRATGRWYPTGSSGSAMAHASCI